MKAEFPRMPLVVAATAAHSVVRPNHPDPALQNIRIECSGGLAELSATDMEIGVRVPVGESTVRVPGSILIDARKLNEFLRQSVESPVVIEAGGGTALLTSGRAQCRTQIMDDHPFHMIKQSQRADYSIKSAALRRALAWADIAAGESSNHAYTCTGVLLQSDESDLIHLVGIDGRRISVVRLPIEMGSPRPARPVIPSRAIKLLTRFLGDQPGLVDIESSGNDMIFSVNRAVFAARTLEGNYPAWERAFAERECGRTETVVGPLATAIRQAALMVGDDTSRGITLTFEERMLRLRSRAVEQGQSESELPLAHYQGESTEITINPQFALDFLRSVPQDSLVSIEVAGADAPLLFRHVESDYRYLLMPLVL